MRHVRALISTAVHRLAIMLIAMLTSAVVIVASPVRPALAADGTLSLTASGPATAAGGGNITYTMSYQCTTAVPADTCAGAILTAQLPTYLDIDGLSRVAAFVRAPGSPDTDDLDGTYDAVLNTVTFTFGAGFVGGHAGLLSVTIATAGGFTPNNTFLQFQPTFRLNAQAVTPPTVSTTIVATTKLKATKVTVNGSSSAGLDADVAYKIEACVDGATTGPLPADNMALTDTIPAGAVVVSTVPAATQTGNDVRFDFPGRTLVGRCHSGVITLRYPSTAFSAGQVVTNRHVASATQPGSGGVIVSSPPAVHDLTLKIGDNVDFDKVADPQAPVAQHTATANVAVGDTLGYGLSFTNSGTDPIDRVRIIDTVPPQTKVTAVYSGKTTPATNVVIEYSVDGGTTWVALGGPRSTASSQRIAMPPLVNATTVRWTWSGPTPVNFKTEIPYTKGPGLETVVVNPDRNGTTYAVPPAVDLVNCAVISWTSPTSPLGANKSLCKTNKIDASPIVLIQADGTNLVYRRGETIRPTIQVANFGTSSTASYALPVISALLPAGFTLVGSTVWQPGSSGIATAPDQVIVIPNFDGAGKTLVRWKWSSPVAMIRGGGGLLQYGVQVGASVPIGTASIQSRTSNDPAAAQLTACASGEFGDDVGDRDGDGFAIDKSCSFAVPYNIQASSGLVATTTVSGESNLSSYSSSATTFVGGRLGYRVTLANGSALTIGVGARFVDILPTVGDEYVRSPGVPRNSQFAPVLTGPITGTGFTVEYSRTADPCRPEVLPTTPAPPPCTAPSWEPWSATLANDPTLVKSLRFTTTQAIAPSTSLNITWQMRVPFDHTLLGKSTNNSFAYAATLGTTAIQSEASPATLTVGPAPSTNQIGDFVWNDINQNGVQNSGEAGIPNVSVQLRTSGPDGSVGTADDIVAATTTTGASGQYTFVGVAPGTYYIHVDAVAGMLFAAADQGANDAVDSDAIVGSDPTQANTAQFLFCSGAAPCNDTTRDFAMFAVSATLAVQPKLNLAPASATTPGTYIAVGAAVNWTYDVTNNGNVDLTSLRINGTVCAAALLRGATVTCSLPAATALIGQQSRSVTFTAQPPSGTPISTPNTSFYFGATVGVRLDAEVNGDAQPIAPGAYVPVNSTVTWTYAVTNTGNSDLNTVNVIDPSRSPSLICTIPTLGAGLTRACPDVSDVAVAGQMSIDGLVQADTVLAGVQVTDDDAAFAFGTSGGLTISKVGDISPVGGNLPANRPITWTYTITNTSNLVVDIDDPIDSDEGTVSCPNTLAAAGSAGDTVTCTVTSQTVAGNYDSTVTVDGEQRGSLEPLTAFDDYDYFGAMVGITVSTKVNTVATLVPTGPYVPVTEPVTFVYTITNTGNSPLTGLTVSDSSGALLCTPTDLLAQESIDCSRSTVALAGQVTNTVEVEAGDVLSTTQTDNDVSYYFGTRGTIQITKSGTSTPSTSGNPAEYLSGNRIDWTYLVTNNSNLPIDQIIVTDNDASITINCAGITSLAANGGPVGSNAMTCTGTSTAVEGDYTSTAKVVAVQQGTGADLTDADDASYFGVVVAVSLTVLQDGNDVTAAPGPFVPVGSSIAYEFRVKNNGNRPVTAVAIDDPARVCTQATLAPDATMTCQITRNAAAGAQTVTATVPFTDVFSRSGTVTDSTFYFGTQGGITIAKTADLGSSGDYFTPVGAPIAWTYTVENHTNLALTDVVVSDDDTDVTIDCGGLTTLGAAGSPTANLVCHGVGTVIADDYDSEATVAAVRPAPLPGIGATAAFSYFGADPSLEFELRTNGDHVTTGDGPPIAVGDLVTYTYDVTNNGNVTVDDITVTDDLTPTIAVCESITLAPNETTRCTRTTSALAGARPNSARVTGSPIAGGALDEVDTSSYFGVDASLVITTSVAGDDADDPATAPLVQAGAPVRWTYLVENSGNATINSIAVSDGAGPITCPATSLAKGVSMTCERTDAQALAGVHTATATASGRSDVGAVASGAESASYFGVDTVVSVHVTTNDIDASAAPGPFLPVGDPVSWSYVITNPGNKDLTGITLGDDRLGNVVCPDTVLSAGASMSCTADGLAVSGQYTNRATVSATTALGGSITATDDSYYFGSTPGLRLAVRINGRTEDTATGALVAVGSTVAYAFDVTNVGDAPLTAVSVTQDPSVGIVQCPATTLAVDETMTCSTDGVASLGQFSSVVTATGRLPGTQSPPIATVRRTPRLRVDAGAITATVRASAAANVFGVTSGITLITLTNGLNSAAAPGATLDAGSPIVWAYTVTNNGNTTVDGIVVTDSRIGAVGCPATSLAAGASMTCTANGSVIEGQYDNQGVATGTDGLGPVRASDDDFYLGVAVASSPEAPPVDPTPEPPTIVVDLPQTGSDLGSALATGLTLLIVGCVLLVARRRRRHV